MSDSKLDSILLRVIFVKKAWHFWPSDIFRLPWDQQSYAGYTATIGLSIMMGESYLILNGSILLLFIAICLHHRAFYNRFENSLHKFNCSNQETDSREILCEIIDFHNTVKGSENLEKNTILIFLTVIQWIGFSIRLFCDISGGFWSRPKCSVCISSFNWFAV